MKYFIDDRRRDFQANLSANLVQLKWRFGHNLKKLLAPKFLTQTQPRIKLISNLTQT
jgi:hypothetical protein